MGRPTVPHEGDFKFVQDALGGKRSARLRFWQRYYPGVLRCAKLWTRWHPAHCGDNAPRCRPQPGTGLIPQACDCCREAIVFVFETLLGKLTNTGFATGKLRWYRGECALDLWMDYLLRRPVAARPQSNRGYGCFALYTDYLRRYRGGRVKVPTPLQAHSEFDRRVFLQLTRSGWDIERIASKLSADSKAVSTAINRLRKSLLAEGWDFYWHWMGSSQHLTSHDPNSRLAQENSDEAKSDLHGNVHAGGSDQDIADTVSGYAALELLRQAMQCLPPRRQLVLLLFFQHGLSAVTSCAL